MTSFSTSEPVGLPAPTAQTVAPTTSEAGTYSKPIPIDPTVLPLALRTIILDPGHGGDNMGTIAPEGLVEKEVTLDIASRVGDLLEQRSYKFGSLVTPIGVFHCVSGPNLPTMPAATSLFPSM